MLVKLSREQATEEDKDVHSWEIGTPARRDWLWKAYLCSCLRIQMVMGFRASSASRTSSSGKRDRRSSGSLAALMPQFMPAGIHLIVSTFRSQCDVALPFVTEVNFHPCFPAPEMARPYHNIHSTKPDDERWLAIFLPCDIPNAKAAQAMDNDQQSNIYPICSFR